MSRVIRDELYTPGTAARQCCKALYGEPKVQRAAIIIRNTSLLGEKISIAIGSEAILGSGIVLNPNDVYSASQDSGYKPPNDFITAIGSAATATMAIHEEIDNL